MRPYAVCPIIAVLWAGLGQTAHAYQGSGQSATAANPFAQDATRREAGRARFQTSCGTCHGPNGEGGQGEGHGPNLIDNPEIRRAKDDGIFKIIQNGIPGTLMPRFPFNNEQIWELVTFVRSLNSPAIMVNVPGDRNKGEAIFFGKGECKTCHMIRGRGGYLGSDLTNIGSSARADDLRRAIESPSRSAPDGFRSAIFTTSDGGKIRAIVKHRSNWSLDLLDKNGNLHMLRGAATDQVKLLPDSWMPSYAGKLNSAEIQDLLAFLSRQSVFEDQGLSPSTTSASEVTK